MANIYGAATNTIRKLAPKVARELGISTKEAVVKLEAKDAQAWRIAGANAPMQTSAVDDVTAKFRQPEKYLGPAKGDNRSLSEVLADQRNKVAPNVDESIAAREASKFKTNEGPRALVPYNDGKPYEFTDNKVMDADASFIPKPRAKSPDLGDIQQGSGERLLLPEGKRPPVPNVAGREFEESLSDLGGVDTKLSRSEKFKFGAGAAGVGAIGTGAYNYLKDRNQDIDLTDVNKAIQEKDKSLSSKLNSTSDTPSDGKDVGTTTSPGKQNKLVQKPAEVKQEANSLMDQFKKNEAIPDNRREEAYKQFSEARTRNEWLDVAQTLAKALAQYGAATSGRAQSGRDMTLPNMPSVDYTGRTATSERELERRIRDFDTDDAAKRDQAKEAKRDEQFEKELAYKKNKDKLELAESSKRDSEKVDWETKMLRQDEIRAAGEERRSEAKSLAGRQQAAQQFEAVYSAMNAPNVDKKARAKYEMQAAELAGKAGIDLGQAEEAGTVPGRFWGTNQDESKRKANLKEQIDAIMSSRKSTGQQQPQPATMQQAPAGRVTIYKDGQPVGTVPQDQVEQAIAQGYTVK